MSKNLYELAVLYQSDLEDQLEATSEKVKKMITDEAGKIVEEDIWGKRDLAYAIKSQTQAIYVFYNIEIEPDKIEKLEAKLNINEDVVRYLFHKIDLNLLQQSLAHPQARQALFQTEELEEAEDTEEVKADV